jgi:hypothetical protein
MLWVWFGLDATGMQRSIEFHWLLGPTLMVAFAFLGNTLFLTILVSMLSNTFSTIVANATAEVHFRRAVLTLEGVKSDAIFAYQPPFNIIAVFVLLPMKFFVSPRWFHKIHVATVRAINLPVLLIIAVAERRISWNPSEEVDRAQGRPPVWFWEKWRIRTHGSIKSVFEITPPESVSEDIAVDDELTHHMIRRQFVRHQSSGMQEQVSKDKQQQLKTPSRRDSISILNEPDQMAELVSRMDALEQSTARMEEMLERLSGAPDEEQSLEDEEMEASAMSGTGTLSDLDKSGQMED